MARSLDGLGGVLGGDCRWDSERRNEMVWDFGPMVYFWRRPRFHINRRLYIQLSEAGRPGAASETVQTGCQGTSNIPSCHSFFFLIDRKGW